MILIINIDISYYNKIKNENCFGKELICSEGFIHASTEKQFNLIASRFKDKTDNTLILLLDSSKLESEIKWEYSSKFNEEFPHIYGLINKSAVIREVLLKDYM